MAEDYLRDCPSTLPSRPYTGLSLYTQNVKDSDMNRSQTKSNKILKLDSSGLKDPQFRASAQLTSMVLE